MPGLRQLNGANRRTGRGRKRPMSLGSAPHPMRHLSPAPSVPPARARRPMILTHVGGRRIGCSTHIWVLHNYGIEAIEEEVAPEEWMRVAAFDGYALPTWSSLPEHIRDALVALNDEKPLTWRL